LKKNEAAMKVIFHDHFCRVYTSDPAASAGRMESIVEVITPHVEFVKAQPASEDQIAFAHDSAQIEYVRQAGFYPIARPCCWWRRSGGDPGAVGTLFWSYTSAGASCLFRIVSGENVLALIQGMPDN
jgi:hypothetical protein